MTNPKHFNILGTLNLRFLRDGLYVGDHEIIIANINSYFNHEYNLPIILLVIH